MHRNWCLTQIEFLESILHNGIFDGAEHKFDVFSIWSRGGMQQEKFQKNIFLDEKFFFEKNDHCGFKHFLHIFD